MSAHLKAELLKIRANPTTWWLLLGTAGVGAIGTLAPLIAADGTPDLLTNHKLQEAMHGAAGGALLVLVAGIIGMSGEWRHGQATQSFLTTPQRWRVVIAKAIAYLCVGALYGIAAGSAALAMAWTYYRGNDLTLPLGSSAIWLTLAGCLAVSTLFGALGVAVGTVARNQVTGIVAVLGWQVLLEPGLFAASPKIFRWMPGTASLALRRQPADGLLTVGPASAILAVTLVGFFAAGLHLVRRSDVTG